MRLVEHLEQEKKWSAGAVLTLSLDPLDFRISVETWMVTDGLMAWHSRVVVLDP